MKIQSEFREILSFKNIFQTNVTPGEPLAVEFGSTDGNNVKNNEYKGRSSKKMGLLTRKKRTRGRIIREIFKSKIISKRYDSYGG